ncbi:MAG: SRPBCC family protein [Methylococcales bacterium]|nr:SRPBCC family protein [Methylococcales bacterium]
MKKLTLFISALTFIAASSAFAHGPVRQKVSEKITINAPAEKVWDIIKNYDDMSWHPAIKSTESSTGNKKGSTRVLTLEDGGIITEQLKKYDGKKMLYQYKITDMSTAQTITHSGKEENVPVVPVSNYAATIQVKDKKGKAEVIWKAGYYRAYMNNNPPEEMNEEAANSAVKGIFQAGLQNLKKLAE